MELCRESWRLNVVQERLLKVRAATIMRRIVPHNSAQSQLNLHPHNSPHNWTKLTRDAAYF